MDKSKTVASSKATEFSIRTLLKYFLFWKILLLVVACLSPGPGYDTSTQILFEQGGQPATTILGRAVQHVVLRLTRWDGIYFASNSAHGHFNEQNWAFSWALARVTSWTSRVFLSPLSLSLVVKNALAGILISTFSHLIAMVALYYLTYNVLQSPDTIKRKAAFAAACLHVISPAGLFLSAPYGESTFAALNFTGALSYALAVRASFQPSPKTAAAAALTLLSGLCFGLSAMVRSNGLLTGLIFAWDALQAIRQPMELLRSPKALTRLGATLGAGILVGISFIAPQFVAYLEYCVGGNTRLWCNKFFPSVYSWVQSHYWGVGFLRYWTLSNAPLFLIAAPVLLLLIYTAIVACFEHQPVLPYPSNPSEDPRKGIDTATLERKVYNYVIPRLALQQLILAVMAATSFHVQIINRISSGYPVWYIVLASAIYSSSVPEEPKKEFQKPRQPIRDIGSILESRTVLEWMVRGMVMYAVVQGGLYASFLPPA